MGESLYVFGATESIHSVYELLNQLGKPGQFGVARTARHKLTGEKFAVKIISKSKFTHKKYKDAFYKELRTEITILKQLGYHANIIRLHDVFEDASHLYLVMERCNGGELFDRIQAKGQFSEKEAAAVLRQIVEALQYLHSKKIAHCDLKPDNFLFLTKDEDSVLKVIDFGMSKLLPDKRTKFQKMCGTPYYVAPEVIKLQYNEACDMWSVGVVMFVMLYGFPPFYADPSVFGDGENAAIFRLVLKGFDPRIKSGYGPWFPKNIQISDSARDLIAKLLKMDIGERYSAEEALDHPWLRGETATDTPLDEHVVKRFKNFVSQYAFKTAVLQVMSDILTDDQVASLQDTFKKIDENGDGIITAKEFRKAMSGLNVEDEEIDRMFENIDVDDSGDISYRELMLTSVNNKLQQKEERLWKAFRKMDKDHNGKISEDELKLAIEDSGSGDLQEVKKLIAEVDRDGDGCVDYEEFLRLWEEMTEATNDDEDEDSSGS